MNKLKILNETREKMFQSLEKTKAEGSSQNNKKIVKDFISAKGFGPFEKIMNCYFRAKIYTDTLIEQTKTKSRKTLEFEMKKQLQIFLFLLR